LSETYFQVRDLYTIIHIVCFIAIPI